MCLLEILLPFSYHAIEIEHILRDDKMLWICLDAILQRTIISLLTRSNEHHTEKLYLQ